MQITLIDESEAIGGLPPLKISTVKDAVVGTAVMRHVRSTLTVQTQVGADENDPDAMLTVHWPVLGFETLDTQVPDDDVTDAQPLATVARSIRSPLIVPVVTLFASTIAGDGCDTFLIEIYAPASA